MRRRSQPRHHAPHRDRPRPSRAAQELIDRLGMIGGTLGAELIGVQQAILASALLDADPVLYEGRDGGVDEARLARDVRKLADRLRHGP